MTKALESLVDNEIMRQKLAKGALSRVWMFSWKS